jgi:hypothetical protein
VAHSTQRIVSEAMQKIHPRTGAPLEPIGSFRAKNGSIKVVWPILGAAEGDDAGADGGGEGGDGSGSEGQGGGEGGGEDKGKQIDPNDLKAVQEELERVKSRMQAADKRASDAETKVKEYEDKDKDELTKTTERVTELETENKALETAVNSLRIENEFLASNKYTWHNPKRALSLADLSEVTITEDGKVEGLDKALDALAKSDAYLLKKEDGEEEPPEGSSGSGAGSGRKGDKGKVADKEALQKKYPALRR